jgi:hypothetical protein
MWLPGERKFGRLLLSVNEEIDLFGKQAGDFANDVPAKKIEKRVTFGRAQNQTRRAECRGYIDNCFGR